MRKNIIVTGNPRSGKSTLLRNLIGGIQPRTGFVTGEICDGGERVGFAIETHLGNRVTLAHIGLKTPHQVSKYFVDVQALELIIPDVSVFGAGDLLYLDEIGQMQLFSKRFRELVSRFLDSSNTCLATLSCVYLNDFIASLKRRDDIILIEIAEENREERGEFVAELLKKVAKARRYVSEPYRFKRRGQQVELQSEHGIRQLHFDGREWACSCDFYALHGVCSHTIAALEFIGTAPFA